MRMQEIAKKEAMPTLEPTSTVAHGGDPSSCHPARWWLLARRHGKVTRRGQPPQACCVAQVGQEAHEKGVMLQCQEEIGKEDPGQAGLGHQPRVSPACPGSEHPRWPSRIRGGFPSPLACQGHV